MAARQWCAVLAAMLLVLVAVTGPMYAFLVISCSSTRSCTMGALLHTLGAECQEGSGLRSESMMHGERCTLFCHDTTRSPSTPELYCNDGVTVGAENLACAPMVVRDTRPIIGGLVAGAVTSGELRTACERAAGLKCDAKQGGTAILLQWTPMTSSECTETMTECRSLNGQFAWSEHSADNNGTCSLGCFAEILDTKVALDELAETFTNPPPETGAFANVAEIFSPDMACDEGPMCIAIKDSCNVADNGDYYRYPLCASKFTQWVQLDNSARLRYDGKPQFSQGGKWIIEQGADPNLNLYGVEVARQPTYNTWPTWGTVGWNQQCRTQIDPLNFLVIYKVVDLTIGDCTCTSEQDCNSNGRAVGSKVNGPNCLCECREGYKGDACETPLCEVPDVLNAIVPACAEGAWLEPNQTCTPQCVGGYVPSAPEFECKYDGTLLLPSGFECRRGNDAELGDPTLSSADTGIYTTPTPACSEFNCFYHGNATGGRYLDGSCICECSPGWTGSNCRTIDGDCKAPLRKLIHKAALAPCQEGSQVATDCTAQCEDGYFAIPSKLTCTGVDLDPPVFTCFGGKSISDTWCEIMRLIAIVTSSVATISLIAGCLCFGKNKQRDTEAFFTRNQLVQVEQDDEGKFQVIHMEGTEGLSHLPDRLIGTTVMGGLAIENGDFEGEKAALALHDGGQSHAGGLRQLGNGGSDAWQSSPYDLALADAPTHPNTDGHGTLALLESQAAPSGPGAFFFRGDQVVLQGLGNNTELNGATGQLVDQHPDTGRWFVALQGSDGMKQVDECYMTKVAPKAPDEERVHSQWLLEVRHLDDQINKNRKEHERRTETKIQRAERERQENIDRMLGDTSEEREEVEDALYTGMAACDIESLRISISRGRAVLEKVKGCPASATNGLVRILQTAESRLEQYDERERARAAKRAHEEKIVRGEAPDWKMTPAEFWKHVENANLPKVNGGLRAKMPLLSRTQDGHRQTILHIACRRLCTDRDDTDLTSRRMTCVKLLLEARATANSRDASNLTPLDLAVCEGGEGADSLSVVTGLRELGFLTAQQVLEEVSAQGQGSASSGGGTRQS